MPDANAGVADMRRTGPGLAAAGRLDRVHQAA